MQYNSPFPIPIARNPCRLSLTILVAVSALAPYGSPYHSLLHFKHTQKVMSTEIHKDLKVFLPRPSAAGARTGQTHTEEGHRDPEASPCPRAAPRAPVLEPAQRQARLFLGVWATPKPTARRTGLRLMVHSTSQLRWSGTHRRCLTHSEPFSALFPRTEPSAKEHATKSTRCNWAGMRQSLGDLSPKFSTLSKQNTPFS